MQVKAVKNAILSTILIPALLCLNAGCDFSPKTDDLVSHLKEQGIALQEPDNPYAANMQLISTTLRTEPDLRLFQTKDKTLVTIYRFKNRDQARLMLSTITNLSGMNRLPQKVENIIGMEKTVVHDNFVVVIRYRAEQRGTVRKLVEHIQTL